MRSKRGPFKVRRGADGSLSTINVGGARREFKNASVGKVIRVRVVRAWEESESYLVESCQTRTLLACQTSQSLRVGEEFLAEVDQQRGRDNSFIRLLTVTTFGDRPLRLDLPKSVIIQMSEKEELLPSEVSDYLDWLSQDAPFGLTPESELNLERVPERELNRWLCLCYKGFQGRPTNLENLKRAIQVVEKWIHLNRPKTEINLVYGLAAVLTLDSLGGLRPETLSKVLTHLLKPEAEKTLRKWGEGAAKFAINLGRRALRSIHNEVLMQYWGAAVRRRESSDELWQRLRRVVQCFEQHDQLNLEDLLMIRQFCYAVELRDRAELRPIALGPACVLGDSAAALKLIRRNEQTNDQDLPFRITSGLIDLYHELAQKQVGRLADHQRQRLQELFDFAIYNQLHLVLADPLQI